MTSYIFPLSIYYLICDGGDSNRQLIRMHFNGCNPWEIGFRGFNIYSQTDPMFFLMDTKVKNIM